MVIKRKIFVDRTTVKRMSLSPAKDIKVSEIFSVTSLKGN